MVTCMDLRLGEVKRILGDKVCECVSEPDILTFKLKETGTTYTIQEDDIILMLVVPDVGKVSECIDEGNNFQQMIREYFLGEI